MKVEKDGVEKEVDNVLVPDYVTAGWKVVEAKAKSKKNVKDDLLNEDKGNGLL